MNSKLNVCLEIGEDIPDETSIRCNVIFYVICLFIVIFLLLLSFSPVLLIRPLRKTGSSFISLTFLYLTYVPRVTSLLSLNPETSVRIRNLVFRLGPVHCTAHQSSMIECIIPFIISIDPVYMYTYNISKGTGII